MPTCKSCGVTVARLFAPGEQAVPVYDFETVRIGRATEGPARLIQARVELAAVDGAGIRITIPPGYWVWATGRWVDALAGSALVLHEVEDRRVVELDQAELDDERDATDES